MHRHPLLDIFARERPPEIASIAGPAAWQFEARALSGDFVHFEVKALASGQPTISIFDYIGDDGMGGGVPTSKIAGALRAIGEKPITVEINSPGGNYFDGVAIYNLLRRHSQPVTVQVLGIAASAASVIAMAGDTIEIAHNAEIMIHEARGVFFGTKSEMAQAMGTLAHVDDAMAATYAARTGMDVKQVAAMMAAETYIRGQDAVDKGFADAVMARDAQPVVYADTKEDLPRDMQSLDKLLAKQGMARSERRDLYKAIKGGTPNAAPDATPNAGNEPEAGVSRLLQALSI